MIFFDAQGVVRLMIFRSILKRKDGCLPWVGFGCAVSQCMGRLVWVTPMKISRVVVLPCKRMDDACQRFSLEAI